MDQQVQLLSGGELQRVALIVALGKPADIFLIDEPSAYLDSEQRIAASKVIKRYGRSFGHKLRILLCRAPDVQGGLPLRATGGRDLRMPH